MESNVTSVHPTHPGLLHVPVNIIRWEQAELKRIFNKLLRVFYEVRNIDIFLIKQFFTTAHNQYITAMKNHTTGQFTGMIYQMLVFLYNPYGKISSVHLSAFKKGLNKLHCESVTTINNCFVDIKCLNQYRKLATH